MYINQIFYFLLTIPCLISGARILGVFQIPAYSHYQLGHMILKELASRGHEVTVLSPFEEKEKVKNLKTIVIKNAEESFKAHKMSMFDFANSNMILDIFILNDIMIPIIENSLNDTNVQRLIKSNEKFDIVIVEWLFSDALYGFCAYYNAHCVVLSPIPVSGWINNQMGNSAMPSYVPETHSRFSNKMNFYERAYNALGYFLFYVMFHVYTLPAHNAAMQKYFPNIPHLRDFYQNVSLTLINSHVSTNPAIPLLPNMIDIGGYHVKTPKALPKDLQEYLDNAKEGVIYFSLGSNLQSQDLHIEKREAMLKAFEGLKEKVLWKWENETLPNQPPNVKLAKWLPQNDLLAHPNIKLFITHGGLLSSLEAIYHGVPIIGIPVYGDQYTNMKNAEVNGYGISLPYAQLNNQNFDNAIKEVLQNPKYMNNAKLRSGIMHDNQMKPLDKAVFWLEYVLRHKGAHHLKSAALNLTWYQYLLLDVLAFMAIVVVTPVGTCYYLCKRKKTTKSIKVGKNKKKQ